MELTEHEKEFIDCLCDEFGAWGIGVKALDYPTIKQVVIDSYHENWGIFKDRLRENLAEKGVTFFDLEEGDVKEVFLNAQGFSEFRLSKWME